MKQLIILVGCAGSGKSTFAKQYYSAYTYINQDSQGKAHRELFTQALENGADVIVDRMSFNKEQRARYAAPAKEHGYEIIMVVFSVPKHVCLTRMTQRTNHETIKDSATAEKVVEFFHTNYQPVTEDEADRIINI